MTETKIANHPTNLSPQASGRLALSGEPDSRPKVWGPLEFQDPAGAQRYVPAGVESLLDIQAEAALKSLVEDWTIAAAEKHASLEQAVDTTDGLVLHFPKISLYHGGPTSGIQQFNPAEESTIGEGFYSTSMPDQAFGYTMERTRDAIRNKTDGVVSEAAERPVVYEVVLSDATFVDLRTKDNIDLFMGEYADYLEQWLIDNDFDADPTLDNYQKAFYARLAREKAAFIRDGKLTAGNLKEVLFNTGGIFTEYVIGLGYDGIIGNEGGERNYTGNHDSWVIMRRLDEIQVTKEANFDYPEVINIDEQREINAQLPPRTTWWDHDRTPLKSRI